MIVSSLLVSLGQLFWKYSMGQLGILIFLGFVFYGLGAMLMIVAFKFGKFSVLHPMISTSYVFAIIYGSIFLNEELSILKCAGVMLVLFGVGFIGGSDD